MENNSPTRLMKTPIWPEYELIEFTNYDSEHKIYKKAFEFNCLVRILGEDGVYYLTRFMHKYKFEVQEEWQSISHMCEFTRKNIRECYIFSICGIAKENIFDTNGRRVFELDKNQIPEKERLLNATRF